MYIASLRQSNESSLLKDCLVCEYHFNTCLLGRAHFGLRPMVWFKAWLQYIQTLKATADVTRSTKQEYPWAHEKLLFSKN